MKQLKKERQEKQYSKILVVFEKLHINIPFLKVLEQMPSYARFMKDILSCKKKFKYNETVMLTEECSAILQNKLPPKLRSKEFYYSMCYWLHLF